MQATCTWLSQRASEWRRKRSGTEPPVPTADMISGLPGHASLSLEAGSSFALGSTLQDAINQAQDGSRISPLRLQVALKVCETLLQPGFPLMLRQPADRGVGVWVLHCVGTRGKADLGMK